MRSFSLLILLCGIVLSGCGFQPVYGTVGHNNEAVQNAFSRIKISRIPNREGQYLRNALIYRLHRNGRAEQTQYSLSVQQIDESLINLDVTRESDTTRGQLNLTTSFTLYDLDAKDVVMNRSLTSSASYNIVDNEFAARVSRENARKNVIEDLAHQIERQLALYFNQ